MVTLGTLSLSGQAGVLAMRRKLLAVSQRLGFSSSKATRLAAAASDHAKDVTRNTALELLVGLNGSARHKNFTSISRRSTAEPELFCTEVSTGSSP